MRRNDPLAVHLALVGTVLFWGFSFVATKMALETFPPFSMVFLRFLLAAGFFLALTRGRSFAKFSRREHGLLFLTALFEPGLYFVFETLGLQRTTAPKAALIIATIPLAVGLFAALLLKERARRSDLAAAVISLFGVGALVVGDPDFVPRLDGAFLGDLLIVGAVISAALYMVIARNLGGTHSSLEITSVQMTWGAIFFLPGFLWELPRSDWGAVSGGSILALAYLTVFATVAAFLLYNHALTRLPASRASVFINLIPVVTATGAWLLLVEVLTPLQMMGGGLVMAAVFGANLPRRRAAAVPEMGG